MNIIICAVNYHLSASFYGRTLIDLLFLVPTTGIFAAVFEQRPQCARVECKVNVPVEGLCALSYIY